MPQQPGFQLIEVPGSDPIEFPDSMSDDAIATILKGYHQSIQRPDFSLNPPGIPAPAERRGQMSEAGLLTGKPISPDSFGARLRREPNPGVSEGAGLAGGLAEYSKDVAVPIGQGAKNIWQGNFSRGAHEMISGAGTAMAPAIIPAAAAAPIPTAAVLGASFLGGKLAKYGASGLGASPEQAMLAEDVGNLLTGYGVVKGAGGMKALFEKGTPAEKLSAALSKTLPKSQWAKVNERLGMVNDKLPEVVGGARNVGEVASRMKQRSLDLGQQFSDAIQPIKDNDISPQIARLRVALEQTAKNSDPYQANAYNAMAQKVSELKTLGQLDDFVAGINKGPGFNRGPESLVRKSLTETVRGITGQDFSPLRLEQSHWYNLSKAAQKAAIPEQLAGIQSKVTSPGRKLVSAATEVPLSKLSAILKGAKLLQPSAKSLIRGIEAPVEAPKGPGMSALEMDQLLRRAPSREGEAAAIQESLLRAGEQRRPNQWATGDPNAQAPEIMERVRTEHPEMFTEPGESSMTSQGAAFDTSVMNQVRAEHPDWSLSQQLQEAAARVTRARK